MAPQGADPPVSDKPSRSNEGLGSESIDAGRAPAADEQPRPGGQSGPSMPNGSGMRFVCDGNRLLRCDLGSSTCQPIKLCTSAPLCDAATGRCSPALCAPGSGMCEGNVLRKCNLDGTEYEREDCESRHCNAMHARCDSCVPFTSACDGERARRACAADGMAYELEACGGTNPYCYEGRCVACSKDEDCPAATCRTPFCSAGACFLENERDGTPCVSAAGEAGTCLNGVVCQ